jgi:DMSO/TMAO reductase YedYZ molybdopterin-dependent catalytic subunit
MGSGSAIAAAAAAAPIAAATEAHAYDPGADERKARYRETDDVKAFYRTNGYETLKK